MNYSKTIQQLDRAIDIYREDLENAGIDAADVDSSWHHKEAETYRTLVFARSTLMQMHDALDLHHTIKRVDKGYEGTPLYSLSDKILR